MKHLIIIIITSYLAIACEPKVIDIKLPEHESKIVVQAILNPDESIFSAWISKTVGILDQTELDTFGYRDTLGKGIYGRTYWIPNATIELFGDDQLIGTLTPNQFLGTYELPISSPLTATKYELSVNVPDFKPVSASQTIPKKVSNISASLSENGGTNSNGIDLDLLEVSINDPANESNYYEIYIHMYNKTDTLANKVDYYPNLFSDDPSIIEGKSVAISDESFDGQQFKAQLYTYNFVLGRIKTDSSYFADLYVQSITADRYLFLKSLDDYYQTANNPFAEPSNLYSNIKDGRGLFSVLKEKKIVLK